MSLSWVNLQNTRTKDSSEPVNPHAGVSVSPAKRCGCGIVFDEQESEGMGLKGTECADTGHNVIQGHLCQDISSSFKQPNHSFIGDA